MATRTETQPAGGLTLLDRPALRHLLLLTLMALALRAPFLNQAFQLDDHYYLSGARYVQTDPLHPARTSYVFQGQMVDMRGHPHPPFVVWYLGAALRVFGEVSEVPFHAVYAVFTLLAVWAVYFLARRFTDKPLYATLLFMAVPAFVVHGNGVESDIAFTALILAGVAAFVYAVDAGSARLLALAAAFLALAGLAAYQAVFFCPILGLYVWRRKRRWTAAYAVCAVPLLVTGGYQLYQRITLGALPASVLMGHFRDYGLQSLYNKSRSALALTGHLAWIVFPALAAAAFSRINRKLWIVAALAAVEAAFVDAHPLFWLSFGIGVLTILFCVSGLRGGSPDRTFLCAWALIFFAGALAIFFAGSARYLMPIAPVIAILVVQALSHRPRWLLAGFALQFALGLGLAWSHYQQSNAYREFIAELKPQVDGHALWINGEWGLQHYGQEAGGKPALRNQTLGNGDFVVTSQLGYPVEVSIGRGERKLVREKEIAPVSPLRLLALNSPSAFSTTTFGVRPFDVSFRPVDTLRAEEIRHPVPTVSWLPMNAPEADRQIISGLYGLEQGQWRWMEQTGAVVVKPLAGPARLEAEFTIPDNAPGRHVILLADGKVVAEETYPSPGRHVIGSPEMEWQGDTVVAALVIDRGFKAPGDERQLGMILNSIGFRGADQPRLTAPRPEKAKAASTKRRRSGRRRR